MQRKGKRTPTLVSAQYFVTDEYGSVVFRVNDGSGPYPTAVHVCASGTGTDIKLVQIQEQDDVQQAV